MLKKNIVSAVFVLILFFPFLTKIILAFTDIKEIQLNGYFTTYEKPEFDSQSFWNGNFQNDYMQYWDNNFSGRNYLLKSYNEVRYTLYRLGSSIIGRNHTVYPEFSLDDMYCINSEDDFSIAENVSMLEKYVMHLENLNCRLKEEGIELLVYTTPNKAYYDPENVPYRYKIQYDDQKVRAYECFKSLISNTSIHFIDSNSIISNHYPVFYPTGVHWSRTAEQEVTAAVIDQLKEKIDIAGIQLESVKESQKPFWRDTDGWDMLNVIRPYQCRFFEYEEKVVRTGCNYDPVILIQGGSYSEGLREDVINNKIGIVNYINYKNAYWDSEGQYMAISEWTELPIEQLLKTDAVVIELNESAIKNCSNGFVEFLDEYLAMKCK